MNRLPAVLLTAGAALAHVAGLFLPIFVTEGAWLSLALLPSAIGTLSPGEVTLAGVVIVIAGFALAVLVIAAATLLVSDYLTRTRSRVLTVVLWSETVLVAGIAVLTFATAHPLAPGLPVLAAAVAVGLLAQRSVEPAGRHTPAP